MSEYFHSVRLTPERCKGCVNCIKRCPTEAIRIRGGKARITEARCIDCGECIRRCVNRAKTAVTDSLGDLKNYEYNVALPAPSLYSQFSADVPANVVLCGLMQLGFDEVFEVALGAEIVSDATVEYLKRPEAKKPAISSACPAVVRLVQVKFPELIDNLIPLEAPVEVAARLVRGIRCRELGIAPEAIGVWFITPCPAKMTAVKQPLGAEKSSVTGAIGISQIYGDLLKAVAAVPRDANCQRATARGVGWALSGGETAAATAANSLVVDEIHNVSEVLEQVALGKIKVDFIEALACSGGCIGGPLMVENRFVAEHRMQQRLARMRAEDEAHGAAPAKYHSDSSLTEYDRTIEPRPIMRLDEDIFRAMYKVEQMEKTLKKLPGLDCGSCGSPNCKALAEDIVQGEAVETDCIFKLRERVRDLAQEMVGLAAKLPPSLEEREES
ncbi:[Fe-Fe] hydrogenase large subunit C-terminal domain-containing protein [Anaeroselena agilis]|uniref:[Fe-Fe] hydrogenase large subunit C-terminal domain-containing protein n=1 Tax=Anaeroselena agilis TaxID=3063788 RepID=A0ABU3NZT0_9FIRM|nr:[Fe-Fe] hydrogenase large subunit C-terminal domain-containing protein [Selenomonadales bacterium 4137-cl]